MCKSQLVDKIGLAESSLDLVLVKQIRMNKFTFIDCFLQPKFSFSENFYSTAPEHYDNQNYHHLIIN